MIDNNKTKLLEIAIGQKVLDLFRLSVGKTGRINTTWGNKTVQGIGACIQRISEEQTYLTKRLTEEG